LHDCARSGPRRPEKWPTASLAEAAGFEVFLTVDKGLQYQQNPAGRRIAILITRAKSNRRQDLLPPVEACRSLIRSIKPGDVISVGE
jgi:hypothetical protein